MTNPKKGISIDNKRSIIQHLMFAVLFMLIILNWEVYRVPSYKPFEQSMSLFIPKAKDFNNSLALSILDAYVREPENGEPNLHQFTKFVQVETDSILIKIVALKQETRKKEFGDLGYKVIERIEYLRDSAFNYFGKSKDSVFKAEFPLSTAKMDFFRKLLFANFSGINKIIRADKMATLNSLEVDVVLAEEFLLFQILNRIHDNYCGFDGFHFWFIPNSYFFLCGSTIKSDIYFVKSLPCEKWNFKKKFLIKVDKGFVDTIPYEHKFTWNFKVDNMGFNVASGTINVQYDTVNVPRPFTFSYFVSAPGIALQLDKANLCYAGVANPIRIHIPGYTADKIKLKIAHAKVIKKEDDLFEVYFDKIPNGKVYAYVEATNKQGRTSTVHSMELKVKNLPAPITNFESYKETGISLSEFKSFKGLHAFASDSAFSMDYEIISFQVEGITHNHQYIEPLTVYGAAFENNHELMSQFNSASVGDKFIFSNIRAKATNGKEYGAAAIGIILK